jgi:phage terminase small subunit
MAHDVPEAAKPLTPKQERFCNEYLKDLNLTQAAIRAGYSADSAHSIGHENLTKPEVQERVQALMAERAARTRIDADYVLQTIRSTIETCQHPESANPNAVLKGCELLGKHLKLFTEKHEHTGKDGGPIQVNTLTDEQLEARIAELASKREAKAKDGPA